MTIDVSVVPCMPEPVSKCSNSTKGCSMFRRTVRDRLTGQKVVLSDNDVQLILRFRRGRTVDPSVDPYAVSLI